MKEFFSKLGQFLILVLSVPFLLLAVMCVLFYIPIDYLKYKKSHYYKDLKLRYPFLIGISPDYKFYNIIREENLPIEYVKNPEDHVPNACGYFLYDKTLIMHNCCCISYEPETNSFAFNIEDTWTKIDVQIDLEKEEVNKIKGADYCNDAIILIDEKEFTEDLLPKAKQSEIFVLHDGKNIVDVLKIYIEANPL